MIDNITVNAAGAMSLLFETIDDSFKLVQIGID